MSTEHKVSNRSLLRRRSKNKSSGSSTLSFPKSQYNTPQNSIREDHDPLREVFRHFDGNDDGKISAFELRAYFGSVGEYMSHEDAQAAIDDLDTDGDQLLGFEDFLKLMGKSEGDGGGDEDEDDLKMAFEMFESEEGSGRITPKSLQRILLNLLGDAISYDECVAIIKVFDIDGNGVLDFHEFHRMMTKSKAEMTRLTVEDATKLLKVAQLEMVKSRLREISKSWMSYSEFVWVCGEGCSDPKQGSQLAKMLDESGNVIVLGNSVCIRPEQVVKAIQGLIPLLGPNANDPRKKEMEELETQKAAIGKKAEALVRRELWCGLGYLVVQSVVFIRLTFWELSWNVMEPICFYVTSIHFIVGYAFFLITSIEPSFKGFYQSRFSAKQKRLMKLHDFDLNRYNELRKVFY